MKYGLRERLSGAVILIALVVIFVPMLFDEPAPRSERPQPVMTIEEPVEVERQVVPDPEPPPSLGEIRFPTGSASRTPEADDAVEEDAVEASETLAVDEPEATEAAATAAADASAEPAEVGDAVGEDPIADLARAADQRLARESSPTESDATTSPAATASGEWAVQVGSFGQPDNAERLQARLSEQGYRVFSRPRDNDLTTVYVGPYASSEEGERAMNELKEQANLQGLLVRVRE